MTAQVFFANIRFGFNDHSGKLNAIQEAHQAHPEQCASDDQSGAIIEFVGKAGGTQRFTKGFHLVLAEVKICSEELPN
jgi:hypothetical protein